MRTKGSTALPSMRKRPVIIDSHEIKSYALIPSMDKVVESWSSSTNPRSACATHSHPALVDKAHWCGAVAASTAFETYWDMVQATNLLMTSPATMPRTPPSGCRQPPSSYQSHDLWWHFGSG